jgi:hypothetical protein
VPYEKGYSFLRSIETLLGRERFSIFLQEYISQNKFKSMTSARFFTLLQDKLSNQEQKELGFELWVYNPGLPETYQEIKCEALDRIKSQAQSQSQNSFCDDMNEWTTQKWQYYIPALPVEVDLLKAVESKFTLSERNAEIRTDWFLKLLDAGISDFDQKIESFMLSVGRGKFIKPLYSKLKEKGRLDFARQIFEKARPSYHPSIVKSIEQLLNS